MFHTHTGVGQSLRSLGDELADAVIVEWAEHVLFKRPLETDLIGDVVAEQVEDVPAVVAFRGRGHAEQEFRCEMVDDALVRFGCGMVSLIDENVVERIRGEGI